MSNLTDLAFPLIENCPSGLSVSCGLTKHELATILIAANMAGSKGYGYANYHLIPDTAYEIAKGVLGKFENKDGLL